MTRAQRRSLLIVCAIALGLVATAAPAAGAVTVPTQPYLMSFHTCAPGATDCNNPANHIVQLAQSADGANWSLVGGLCTKAGATATAGKTKVVCKKSGKKLAWVKR
jgi:hypothetical protein